jgi:hypothetical protein
VTYAVAVIAIVVGIAGIRYGANDDSPGLVLICVLLVVGAAAAAGRRALRNRD